MYLNVDKDNMGASMQATHLNLCSTNDLLNELANRCICGSIVVLCNTEEIADNEIAFVMRGWAKDVKQHKELKDRSEILFSKLKDQLNESK